MMTYGQAMGLDKGDRIEYLFGFTGKWETGTIVSKGTLCGGPSVWVHFDDQAPGQSINIPIATNVTEDAWNREELGHGWKLVSLV